MDLAIIKRPGGPAPASERCGSERDLITVVSYLNEDAYSVPARSDVRAEVLECQLPRQFRLAARGGWSWE